MEDKIMNVLEQLVGEVKTINKRLGNLEQGQVDMSAKVENNHQEVISKLNAIEKDQAAIMRYIINSDVTFKKSEEAFNIITKLKEAFSK